jgi:hypothetical protein
MIKINGASAPAVDQGPSVEIFNATDAQRFHNETFFFRNNPTDSLEKQTRTEASFVMSSGVETSLILCRKKTIERFVDYASLR